jgi:urease accessory protein
MFDASTALALLQYGDSAFPAGGFAFSWGVEGLAADGLLNGPVDFDDIVQEHLANRWASLDRVLLARAYAAAAASDIAAVDRLAEGMTLQAPLREGSRRAGRALLGVSVRRGGALSLAYRAYLNEDDRLGHLPVMQAVVLRDAGLSLDAAELLSGWTLVNGLASAAVRLGVLGHVDAQRSFTPLIDIAIARAPLRSVRLFTT